MNISSGGDVTCNCAAARQWLEEQLSPAESAVSAVMARNDYMPTYIMSSNGQPAFNPLRPYYTPGLHHQHNYTSLPSSETIPGHTPEVFDHEGTPIKSATANFTSFAALKYFMTMLTSPFDVGTTLLQVQYAPHESVEVLAFPEAETPAAAEGNKNLETASTQK